MTWKILFAISMGKDLAILNTENIRIYLHFLPRLLNIYQNLTFLISQGSVATSL